jgi:hypothetical protein
MPNFSEEDPWTSEEILEAIYCLEYVHARNSLREGTHPDAVRLNLLLALEQEPTPSRPQVVEAQYRGLEDALAGRPPSPRAIIRFRHDRTWRLDAGRPACGP